MYLNVSSNDIGGEGLNFIFQGMTYNTSVTLLDISSTDASHRNRFSKKCYSSFKDMLVTNKIMTHLIMNGINLCDDGMNYLIKALNFGLEENIKIAKEMEKPQVGKYIATGETF